MDSEGIHRGWRVPGRPGGLPVQGLEIAVTELRPREQRDIGIGPAWAMKHPAPGRGRRVEVVEGIVSGPSPVMVRSNVLLPPASGRSPDVDGFPCTRRLMALISGASADSLA